MTVASAAVFSNDPERRYRYMLMRQWDNRPDLPVVMLNPSTADERKDDPTIRTLAHFAKLWGFGGLFVMNLFAFRSSSPAAMLAADAPLGPDNSRHLNDLIALAKAWAKPILIAWGDNPAADDRADWFCARARAADVRLICLGYTKAFRPKHPMARGKSRIPRDQQPVEWVW